MSLRSSSQDDTATTVIYTLSLHDALPICEQYWVKQYRARTVPGRKGESQMSWLTDILSGEGDDQTAAEQGNDGNDSADSGRSEEHTSELQSLAYLVCRLLLEKKNKKQKEI